MGKLVLVFDCGATNVRVVAINEKGEIAASKSYPNRTVEDPHYPGGRIWDVNELWGKLCDASKHVISQIDSNNIIGVTVTTFGVDGTFLDAEGKYLYPVISWQCERTNPIMEGIDKYIPLEELYGINGVYPYNFNTINKFIWFKENRLDVLEQAKDFLFMPSLFIQLLSGERVNDSTMMGTSMLTDIKSGKCSDEIMNRIDVSSDLLANVGQPGDVVGKIISSASKATGIPEGVAVCLAGHDTQFAVFGSGANESQVVLSSGTWEILMSRSGDFLSGKEQLDLGISTEQDACKGKYNPCVNWLGSGVLEWMRKNFYPEFEFPECYEVMINEASKVKPGANGIKVIPDFYNTESGQCGGAIQGLHLNCTRAEIYRATLEALAYKLRDSLRALELAGNFKAEKIICVGGGSKNALWNQIRADVCNIPIELIDQKETTVLGASMFVFSGLGIYSSAEGAQKNIDYNSQLITPSENAKIY